MSNFSPRTADCPFRGRGPGHVIYFRILHALNFSGVDEHRIVKFSARFGPRSIVTTNCPQVGVVKVTWRLNFLANISVNISKKVHNKDNLHWKTNRKSYLAYRMAETLVTLNDLQGHSQVACLFKCNPSNIYVAFYMNSTDYVLAVLLR